MSTTTVTESFVDKVLALTYASLPPEAIDISKQVAIDGLGVALAGSTEPLGVGRLSIAYVRQMGGAPQASVIAGGYKTSMQEASYVNGTLAHALDWDNNFFPFNHPMSPTLPAILAIAEHSGLSGARVIEAIATAFEVQGRVRMAATGLNTGTGFHKPGTTGTFGAVAAAAKLLQLNRQQTLMAFGVAGSRACSLASNTGTMTKSSHSGHAARMGVECAMLAKMGWTANPDVFGPKGFFDTFMPGNAKPELLVENFGAPLRMISPGVAFKKYPSNYQTHRSIDAALALRRDHGIQPEQIERVETVFSCLDYVNRQQPLSGLDAKFSIQYTTAVALLDGEVTVESFTDERRLAEDMTTLLRKVEFRADPAIPIELDEVYTILNVWLKDGRHVSKRIDKLAGWMGNPLTQEERIGKFYSCTRRVIDTEQAERMLDLVQRLETLPDVVGIMDIARCDKAL